MTFVRRLVIILSGFASLASGSPVFAQNCNHNIPATAPSARFHDNRDGSITDRNTGLQWSRCSLGETWDNNNCMGKARALPYAIAALAAETGWRLPSVSELSSLIELHCSQPAINKNIFPTADNAVYWTATRFVNRDGNFWQVHFLHGESVPEKADGVAFVRLVRKKATE